MADGMRYAAKMTFVVSLALSLVLIIFPEQLMSLYTYNDTMVEHRGMLSWVLFMDGFLLVPFALTSLGSAMLQSMKRSKMATTVMFVWAFIKLGMMYVANLHSFEAVIFALVLSHYVVLALMYAFVLKEARMKTGSGRITRDKYVQ